LVEDVGGESLAALFHLADEVGGPAAEEAIEQEAGDGDGQAGRGGDERLCDTACEGDRLGGPVLQVDCIEGANHAEDGSEQSDHGCDDPEVVEVLDSSPEL